MSALILGIAMAFAAGGDVTNRADGAEASDSDPALAVNRIEDWRKPSSATRAPAAMDSTSSTTTRRNGRAIPRFRQEGRWHMDLRARTNLPTDLGGGLVLETPARIQISAMAGYMPGFYEDIAAKSYGAVIAEAGDYIRTFHDTADRTFYFNPSVALRPAKRSGFVLEAGYRWLKINSDVGTTANLAADLGVDVPSGYDALLGSNWTVSTQLHQVTAAIGYEIHISRIVLRLDVGGAYTLHAGSRMTPDDVPSRSPTSPAGSTSPRTPSTSSSRPSPTPRPWASASGTGCSERVPPRAYRKGRPPRTAHTCIWREAPSVHKRFQRNSLLIPRRQRTELGTPKEAECTAP
jgi:hypothetical protein